MSSKQIKIFGKFQKVTDSKPYGNNFKTPKIVIGLPRWVYGGTFSQ